MIVEIMRFMGNVERRIDVRDREDRGRVVHCVTESCVERVPG